MAKLKKKVWLIISSIFLSLLLLIFIIGWYIVNNIEDKVRDFLVAKVNTETEGLYHLDIDKIRIKFIDKIIRFERVTLYCDTTVLNKIQQQKHPKFIYDVDVKAINLEVASIKEIYKEKKLRVNRFELGQPRIIVYKQDISSYTTDTTHRSEENNTPLPSFLYGLTLKEVAITNGSYFFDARKDKDSVFYVIEDCNVKITNLSIDSSFNLKKSLPHYDDFELSLGHLRYEFSNYMFDVNNVSLNLKDSLLHVDSLFVIPKYSKHTFAYKTKIPFRVELTCENINVFKFDFGAIAYQKMIKADSVSIGNIAVYNYKNKNVPPTPIVKPLFHQIIQQLPMKIDIPVVEIKAGNVIHEELAINRYKSGYIAFNGISGTIKGLTNIVQDKNQYIKVFVHATFMKSGKINAEFHLPVDPQNQRFTLTGKATDLNMKEINTMIEPIAHLSVQSGKVNELNFNLKGNNKTASVEMLLLYNDLEVAVLTSDNLRKRWLLSELANNLILIKDNPKEKQKNRIAVGSANRNLYLSHFNFLWITLFEGLKESVGFTNQKQQMVTTMLNKKNKQGSDKKIRKQYKKAKSDSLNPDKAFVKKK